MGNKLLSKTSFVNQRVMAGIKKANSDLLEITKAQVTVVMKIKQAVFWRELKIIPNRLKKPAISNAIEN